MQAQRGLERGEIVMQVSRFTNGGFVLHRVEGRFSCWYDREGKMLDADQFIGKARSYTRAVKQDSATWQRLAKLGAVFKQ